MPANPDAFVFPWPWLDLRGLGSEEREGLVRELLVEVGPDHPLVRQPVEALAHFMRQDEVLYSTADGYVIVHLTMAQRYDAYTVPRPFPDWDAVVAEVEEMAAEW